MTPGAARSAVVDRLHQMCLLGMLASGYAAIVGSGELDWPATALMGAALLLRALHIAGKVQVEIPPRTVAILTLVYVAFYPLDYYYLSSSFLGATVHMIFFLGAIKILTARTFRDFTYIKVIATLELFAAALLSTSLTFFAFLAAFVLCGIASFASGEVLRSLDGLKGSAVARRSVAPAAMRGFPRRLWLLSVGLFCGIFVMTSGMFFVLPRTARAALQRFVPERYHLPGFANEVSLGDIGEIKQNNTAVMHIRRYSGDGLLPVRWRGGALGSFDGKRWFNPPAREQRLVVQRDHLVLAPARPDQASIGYEVQLNEIASDTLFFAGTPATISIQVPVLFRSASGSLRVPRISVRGLHYAAYSFLDEETRPEGPQALTEEERAGLLKLPAIDSRIPDLAREWTVAAPDPMDQAAAIERRFHRDYGYTLELLPEEVADPLATFLFERRAGHCEYFASAMAVMLRTLGIPARLATGFGSGVYNSMTGWQVVRAADAHTWVEAWIPGRGWTTFDPTPPDPNGAMPTLWSKAMLLFDAADQFWHDWVVGYDFQHQVELAARMQAASRRVRFAWFGDLRDWSSAVANFARQWVLLLLVAGVLVFAALLYGRDWWQWAHGHFRLRRAQGGGADPSDATILYERMLELLAGRGYQKPPWLTPAEFVRVLPQSEMAMLVEDLTGAYNQVRFGGRHDAKPRMVRLLRRIEMLLQ